VPERAGERRAGGEAAIPVWARQDGFDVRFDWGPNGLRALAPVAAVVVVVDVLSFTTSVSIAVGRGAEVLPYRWQDERAPAFAEEHGAVLAARRTGEGGVPWSLSPSTLVDLPAGTRLVLPSPNGSALSFAARDAGATAVLAGCLRNAGAVAAAATRLAGGGPIVVLAAGERWRGQTGSLRPGFEDLVGAGAIANALPGALVRSPEAAAAEAAFASVADLAEVLHACAGGRELTHQGRPQDVDLAAALDVESTAPLLAEAAYLAGA
jgi:2-phosphosulfolactate phosphatase